MFPKLETLIGDRDGKLDALKGGSGMRWWTPRLRPRIVKMSAELLAPSVKQYVFISSISVYPETVPSARRRERGGGHHGGSQGRRGHEELRALKALCEKEVSKAFPSGATNVRPGLIVAPRTPPTGSPTAGAPGRESEVLAPGTGRTRFSWIDVRDLVRGCAHDRGEPDRDVQRDRPEKPVSMKEMLEACKKGVKSDATLVWAPAPFLEEQKVGP
jgi:2'-hydroxyisoflavone reductase